MAEGWGRRSFIGKWRRLGSRDPRWQPPQRATLRRTLAALDPTCLWLEALSRETSLQGSSFERPVATAAVRRDPVAPGTGYLTMLQFVNDRTTLDVLLGHLAEALAPLGVRTLIGPTHPLPHLGGGALGSHWHQPPPPDTLYGPPYVPEHLDALMSPLDTSVSFSFGLSTTRLPTALWATEVRLEPLILEHLAGKLLPLLQAATVSSPALSSPDATEAELMVRWLEPYRPTGFLATLKGQPAGFVLLYASAHRAFRPAPRSGGRAWGGVLPKFQRQGVGGELLGAALKTARDNAWESVSVGPVSQRGEAAAFLRTCGGAEAQRYILYRTEL